MLSSMGGTFVPSLAGFDRIWTVAPSMSKARRASNGDVVLAEHGDPAADGLKARNTHQSSRQTSRQLGGNIQAKSLDVG